MNEVEARDQYKKIAVDALEEASSIKIDISAEGAAYHRQYISDKVAKISSSLERLNELLMNLTKVSLQARRIQQHYAEIVKFKKINAKVSAEYAECPRDYREKLLSDLLAGDEKELDIWESLYYYITEVKTAIADKAATIRRIDSDLRLQQKLLEVSSDEVPMKTAAFRGLATEEIDL